MATISALGKPGKSYRPTRNTITGYGLGAVLLIAISIFFILGMIYLVSLILSGETPMDEVKRDWFIYLLGVPILTLSSLYSIYSGADTIAQIFKIRRKPPLYILYEKGVLIKEDGTVTAILWEDVDDLLTKFQISRIIYTQPKSGRLKLKDGRDIEFSTFVEHYDELNSHIETQVLRLLVPRLMAQFRQQGSLTSGSLVIDKAGIQTKKKRFGWAEIEKIYLQNVPVANTVNVAVALRNGKGEKVLDWSGVPNPIVMMHLINAICEQYKDEFQ